VNFTSGDTMNYMIKLAEKQHMERLPSIERATAEIIPLEDLPLMLRSEVTSVEMFKSAK
jgi:hypothetical protein